MIEAFEAGGLWMWVITVFCGAFYALLVAQFVMAKTSDFTLVLVGVLAALVLTGPLGTYVGLHQAGLALESYPVEQSAALLGKAIGIAHVTSAYSSLLAVPGAIALGIAASRVRRHAAARSARA